MQLHENRAVRVEFTGTRSELFGLLLRGYLLMVPTIGIYRFWLTTWKRRFYWQNTVIDGDPLEYTGNALQLLIGFLFALAFFLPLYLAFFWLSTQAGEVVIVGYGVLVVLFWFVTGYALYRARDFRLSRTLWRGIRFNQHGNAWAYALRRFLWSIAMIPTLGLVYPWMASSLWRYRYNHTWYGDRRFAWRGSWRTIAGPYFKAWAVIVGGLIGLGAMLATSASGSAEEIAGAVGIAIFVWLPFVMLAWLYFRAREASRMFSQVAIGEAMLTVRVHARSLLAQYVYYVLALAGALLLVGAIGGVAAAMVLTEGFMAAGETLENISRNQLGIAAIAGLVGGYLIVFGTFALMGEVFLGYGYWMLVARGAMVHGVDSLLSVRATAEDESLAGEGLADALNVGSY